MKGINIYGRKGTKVDLLEYKIKIDVFQLSESRKMVLSEHCFFGRRLYPFGNSLIQLHLDLLSIFLPFRKAKKNTL